jgi:cysteinyl-tRNA synthetase
VDDKIIKKCRSLKITDAKDLTGKYTDIFMHDLSDLNILPASRYPRATDHIPDIVKMIEDLRDVGLAYRDPDGWWFDVSQKSGYGSQLVNVASLSDEVDIDADGDQDYRSDNVKVGGMPKGGEKVKNNKRDFALWKAYKEGVDIDR